jgi:hypothetical protein
MLLSFLPSRSVCDSKFLAAIESCCVCGKSDPIHHIGPRDNSKSWSSLCLAAVCVCNLCGYTPIQFHSQRISTALFSSSELLNITS